MKSLFLPRFFAILAAAIGMIAGSSILYTPTGATDKNPFQSEGEILRTATRIPGQYIVIFRDNVDPDSAAQQLASVHGGAVGFTYRHVVKGFSIRIPEAAAAAISKDSRVRFVEEDGLVSVVASQSNATWGLDRIDQRDLPLNTVYNYNATGAGVNVYVIDTGIRVTHQNFGGRASIGFDSVGDGQNGNDCNGHGTHVSGTVGSATYGVAKSVNLIAVRVLNCSGSGSFSGVIAGIDWVTANRVLPAVANMSLGGGASSSVDAALQNSVAAGVTYVVAAGNSAADACNSSPARAPAALTIGATDKTDLEASFSNFGSCVDLLAPGVSITSAWNTSDTAINTISGTSMASPHVAGAAALYLETNPFASPSQVEQAIEGNATPNKIGSMASALTPNLLVYTLNFGGGTPPPPPSSITLTARGYKVKGLQKVDLSWSGAVSVNMDVFRNGVKVITTPNDGFYTDPINKKGTGVTYKHKVCEAGTSICSNETTVVF